MDDSPRATPRPPEQPGPCRRTRCAFGLAAVALACSLTGCSLFVMAGKMFYGDPKVTSPFRNATGIDLAKEGRTVLVIFSTPESVKAEFPSIEFDLTEETIRRLKRREITVIDPDEVATFIDDNGGFWHDEQDLARAFDCDIIVHVDLDSFTVTEDNSPWMLRGRAAGNVFAYRVKKVDGEREAHEIFVREFTSTHPHETPVSADTISRQTFQKRYVDLMATQIGQILHDHRASELIH